MRVYMYAGYLASSNEPFIHECFRRVCPEARVGCERERNPLGLYALCVYGYCENYEWSQSSRSSHSSQTQRDLQRQGNHIYYNTCTHALAFKAKNVHVQTSSLLAFLLRYHYAFLTCLQEILQVSAQANWLAVQCCRRNPCPCFLGYISCWTMRWKK